jgi:hypothetical protein
MRASEFITETSKQGQVRIGLKRSGPHAKRYDSLDTFYHMYRLGLAIANGDAGRDGATSNSPTVWLRGPEEEEMVTRAERAMGIKGTVIVPSGPSEEMKNINKTSPVANWNKRK